MANPLRVTGAWVQLLTDWLDFHGLPAPALRALLDSRRPADEVPLSLWHEMLTQATSLRAGSEVPAAAALAIGAMVQPRHVGVLGYLILACETLGEAMVAYQRYERLFYGVDIVTLAAHGADMEVAWPALSSGGMLADTVAIAALLGFVRRLLGGDLHLQRVTFVFAAPQDAEVVTAYERFFRCPVEFYAARTAVVFPLAYLQRRLPNSDPSVRELLDQQAQTLLLAVPGADAFERALQQTLMRMLPDGRVSLSRVAGQLHMSVRTLQRRLDERRQTWREVLDSTRERLACHYLLDASLTGTDIAFLLGFSEQSAFNRAFRRWTGTSPERFRRQPAVTGVDGAGGANDAGAASGASASRGWPRPG